MGPSENNQHSIRRSTRLPLEVPVLLVSLNSDEPFSEQCNTTLVNAHGCGLIVGRLIPQGIQVRLEIVSAKRHTTGRVAEVVPLGGDPETWLVGLELDTPGNFWGIEYAPSDWKIAETLSNAVEQSGGGKAGAKPSHAARWRLTDISGGACYLETAGPFATGAAVLLSIRAMDAECLLRGIVRVSHPQKGMGVEFTAVDGQEQRGKAEELIRRLMNNREAPKIFVGREERPVQTKGERMPNSATDFGGDSSSSDPLLDLIRLGSSVTAEQFLHDLRAQRLGNRRDPRLDLALPVLLTGTDASGRPLSQRVMTINISRRGALLDGIHGVLRPGDVVQLARLQNKEEFRVAWVGADGSPAAAQIGVAAVDPNTSFWNEVLEATSQSGLETASLRVTDGEAEGQAGQ